jgi:hypothetical protein
MVTTLVDPKNPYVANIGAVFSIAKMFDNGKLSEQDVKVFMNGDPSIKAKAERSYQAYIKGKMRRDDLDALKIVAEAAKKKLLIRYEKELNKREETSLARAKKYGMEQDVKDIFGAYRDFSVVAPTQRGQAPAATPTTAPATGGATGTKPVPSIGVKARLLDQLKNIGG